MSDTNSAKITNLSDEELDQVSSGGNAEDAANASMAMNQAEADAKANREF